MTVSASAQTAAAENGDALLGLAALGKTASALVLVVGLILACSWLLRRLGPGRLAGSQRLQVVASTAVGQRERVVVVDLEGTWLVLGVGGGQVNKLHDMPAPEMPADRSGTRPVPSGDSFPARLGAALKQNFRDRTGGSGQ